MKIPILCCLSLSIVSVYSDRQNNGNANNGANNGLNLPDIKMPSFGLNLPSASPIVAPRPFGLPRKLLPFMPVPVVKKVTHHHIHHVIAHKGVVKSKFSNEANNGFDFDNKDNDNNSGKQSNFKSYKEDFGLNGEFNDNGFKSAFLKKGEEERRSPRLMRGGVSAQHLGDLLASSSGQNRRGVGQSMGGISSISGLNGIGGLGGGMGGSFDGGMGGGFGGGMGGGFGGGMGGGMGGGAGIRGYFGGQRAEFVPLIIGIIDDQGDLISGFSGGSDSNKEYSSRKGLLRPEANNQRNYIPSKETIKLFEELAKMGYK